jgi:hypothetical protein
MWSGGEVQRWIDENIEPLWNARAAVEQAKPEGGIVRREFRVQLKDGTWSNWLETNEDTYNAAKRGEGFFEFGTAEAPPAGTVEGGSLMDYLKTGKLADKPADSAGVTEAMVEAACLESHQAWDIHWYYSEVWKVAMREKMRRVLTAALSAARGD